MGSPIPKSPGPVQVKRRIGSAGAPPSLLQGQLAVNDPQNGTTQAFLYGGVGYSTMYPTSVAVLVGNTRQVELTGTQTITGTKTISINALKIPGGSSGAAIVTDGLGNLTFVPGGGGVFPEAPADGQVYGRDGQTASWVPVVPTTGGTFTGSVNFTGVTTLNGVGLVSDAPFDGLLYVRSNGTWVILPWLANGESGGGGGGGAVAASQVSVSPPVLAQNNVQAALQSLAAVAAGIPEAPTDGQVYGRDGATTSWDPVLPLSGGTMLGNLILNGPPSPEGPPNAAATIGYVDGVITGALQYIGTMNASTGLVTYTESSGIEPSPGALLPAAETKDQYVIVAVSGTIPSAAPAQAGGAVVNVGDWLISDGTEWQVILVSGQEVLGEDVAVSPPVLGQSNVQDALTAIVSQLGQYAPITSPAFNGIPTAPTAAIGTNSAQIATTSFVADAIASIPPVTGFLPLIGGTLSGPLVFSGGNGVSYNATSLETAFPGQSVGTHAIQFGWDGASLFASVDGTGNPGALAAQAWVGQNYLPLVGGTLTGQLNINTSGGADAPVGTLYLLGPTNGVNSLYLDSYGGATSQSNSLFGRAAGGTVGAPAALAAGVNLLGLRTVGHNGSNYLAPGMLLFTTTENWSPAGNGTQFTINTRATGTTSSVVTATFLGNNTYLTDLSVSQSTLLVGSTTMQQDLTFTGGNGIIYNLASFGGVPGVNNNQIAFGWNGTNSLLFASVDGTGSPGYLVSTIYANATYLPLTGGTLTGSLVVNPNVSAQQFFANGINAAYFFADRASPSNYFAWFASGGTVDLYYGNLASGTSVLFIDSSGDLSALGTINAGTGVNSGGNVNGINLVASAAIWQGTATPTGNAIAAENFVSFGYGTIVGNAIIGGTLNCDGAAILGDSVDIHNGLTLDYLQCNNGANFAAGFSATAACGITGGLTVDAINATSNITTNVLAANGGVTFNAGLNIANGNLNVVPDQTLENNLTMGGVLQNNSSNAHAIWLPNGGMECDYPGDDMVAVWVPNMGGNQVILCGNGGISATGFIQISDARNKNNINLLSKGVSLVKQLLPKSFEFNNQPGVEHWGFIAQDVQETMPQAVETIPAKTNDEGTASSPETLALDPMNLVAVLAMAVKQLINRITALEAAAGIEPDAPDLA